MRRQDTPAPESPDGNRKRGDGDEPLYVPPPAADEDAEADREETMPDEPYDVMRRYRQGEEPRREQG